MLKQAEERYERQILLPEIGEEGQRRLEECSVLVIGAGGLGGPVLQYLAAAGIGCIGVMDGDVVSMSNLNRQILYGTRDVGRSKAQTAARRLREINDRITINAVDEMLTEENARERIRGYDALTLCLDSVDARKIANRACILEKTRFVEAGVQGFYGVVTTVLPGETPCYECIQSSSQQEKCPVPILGAMAGWVGCAEAMAAIRLLLGKRDPSQGALVFFDGVRMTVEAVSVKRNPECPVCASLSRLKTEEQTSRKKSRNVLK